MGALIKTPTGYEPILGFLHAEDIEATYLRVSTASASMALSVLHQAFVNGTAIWPAGIKLGDLLHTPRGLEPVTRVETVQARGAYHILVKDGARTTWTASSPPTTTATSRWQLGRLSASTSRPAIGSASP